MIGSMVEKGSSIKSWIRHYAVYVIILSFCRATTDQNSSELKVSRQSTCDNFQKQK